MEVFEIEFQHRGRTVTGSVAIPSDLGEAVTSLGNEMTYECFREGYIERQKKQIRNRRQRKNIRIKISDLTEEQRETLQKMKLL